MTITPVSYSKVKVYRVHTPRRTTIHNAHGAVRIACMYKNYLPPVVLRYTPPEPV